jgi:hypothetical protein
VPFLSEKYPDVMEAIARDKVLSDTTTDALKRSLTEFKGQFKP